MTFAREQQSLLNDACGHLARIVVLEQVDSTNAWLLARLGAPPAAGGLPTACWALEQVAGRGRRDKPWLGDPQASIALSLAFSRPTGTGRPLSGLPLAVGVAVVQALADRVPQLGLKWPNDIQRNGRKCGGILIEMRNTDGLHEHVIVGVGLNLLADEQLRQAIAQPVCGLFDDNPNGAPARATIVAGLIRQLVECWQRFQREGLAAFAARWQALDVLRDRFVVVEDAGQRLLGGVASGITESGALKIATDEGVVAVFAGDVSVRAGKG